MTVDIVLWLQQFDQVIINFFFQFISFLGEEYVYIITIGIIYYAVDKEIGRFIAFSLFATAGLNATLKGLIQAPRPFEEYSSVENLRPETAGGSSFPSGHTQSFSSFLSSISLSFKRHFMYYISAVLIICMMLSRMYLGVHYFEDVITGALLGVGLSIVLFILYKKYNTMQQRFYLFGITTLLFLPFLLFVSYDALFKAAGMLLGFTLAYWFEETYVQFHNSVSLKNKVIRVVIGLITMLLIQAGGSMVFSLFAKEGTTLMNLLDLFRYFLISFIGLGVVPLSFKYIK